MIIIKNLHPIHIKKSRFAEKTVHYIRPEKNIDPSQYKYRKKIKDRNVEILASLPIKGHDSHQEKYAKSKKTLTSEKNVERKWLRPEQGQPGQKMKHNSKDSKNSKDGSASLAEIKVIEYISNRKVCKEFKPDYAQEKPANKSENINNHDAGNLMEGVISDVASVPAIINAANHMQVWNDLREAFYPSFGATADEEKQIFLRSLELVTKGLDGDEKSKAVLIHIQERLKETGTMYELDQGADNLRSVDEMLSIQGQGIDCEDSAFMMKFWGDAAIANGATYLKIQTLVCFLVIRGVSTPGMRSLFLKVQVLKGIS